MRRGLILLAMGVVLTAGVIVFATRSDDHDPNVEAASSGFETRSLTAGEVDLKIEPLQLDDQGAVFTNTLDTHSVELDTDLTLSTLEVDGRVWPVDTWSGDGPGGHHREGELRFEAAGGAAGTATLTIPELPEPVLASWELEG